MQATCDYTPDPYTTGWGCQEPEGHETAHTLGWDAPDLGWAHLREQHKITTGQEEAVEEMGLAMYHVYLHDMEEDAHMPMQCYRCNNYIVGGEETEETLVDLDPGDPEVGPQPDVQMVTVHLVCPKQEVDPYEEMWGRNV